MSMILCVTETLVNNQSISASGNTISRGKGEHEYLIAYINVGGVAGSDTPTMTVQLQSSPDNNTWYNIESSVAITAAGQNVIRSSNFGKYVRLNYTLTGTNPVFSGVSISINTKG